MIFTHRSRRLSIVGRTEMDHDLVRQELRERCDMVNPPPCDPEVCGITGVPCPRCEAKFVQGYIDQELLRLDIQEQTEAKK